MERVLRRRADKGDGPLLHSGKQCILAGAVEAVHLIQKQNGLGAVQCLIALSTLDYFPHILDRGFDRIQADEFPCV